MSKKTDPRTTAKRLVAQAAGKPDSSEGRNFAMKACLLIHEHKLLDMLSVPTPAAAAAAVGETIGRGKDFVDGVKQAAADPNVQKVASSLGEMLTGLGSILAASKKAKP